MKNNPKNCEFSKVLKEVLKKRNAENNGDMIANNVSN